jgi:hypothetical protein
MYIGRIFRFLCDKLKVCRDREPRSQFKTGFSRFCAIISVKQKPRMTRQFYPARNVSFNNIGERHSLTPSYSSGLEKQEGHRLG